MASSAVYKFLNDQNRPFSLNEICENTGKEYSKTVIQKSLDDLLRKNKVFEKTYGKQKVYCVTQNECTNGDDNGDELRQLDQEINKLSQNVRKCEEELQAKTTNLQALQGKMTTAEAKLKRNQLREVLLNLKNKLQSFKDQTKPITAEEKNKIMHEHEKYLKEFRKRKRISMDILNSILENYPKTKKHLYEEIGIETDEDVNFSVESF